MFRIVGMIVVFYFIYKIGKSMNVGNKRSSEKKCKIERQQEKAKEAYFYETVIDSKGRKVSRVRAVERITEDDFNDYLNG